jgi:hypothetical protein
LVSAKNKGGGANMRQGPPFSKQNRPWLSDDCIAAMNQAYLDCISKIRPEHREALKEWAASMVEMGYLLDHPEVMELCQQWGQLRVLGDRDH